MPVYTFVHENKTENTTSDKAAALVEAAIQSVLDESFKDTVDKVKNAGKNVGYFAYGAAKSAEEKLGQAKDDFEKTQAMKKLIKTMKKPHDYHVETEAEKLMKQMKEAKKKAK